MGRTVSLRGFPVPIQCCTCGGFESLAETIAEIAELVWNLVLVMREELQIRLLDFLPDA